MKWIVAPPYPTSHHSHHLEMSNQFPSSTDHSRGYHPAITTESTKGSPFRRGSRAPFSYTVPPLPMEPKLHDGRKRSASASYPPEVTSRRAHTPAVEDNEEAKICTVERRVSLQSSFALAVTIPPPERSRTPFRPKKIAKDLPPLQAVPNGSIMVTVDVEQIDDTGNRLGGTRSAARL